MSEVVSWVLSSSVIVACITYIANTKIKNKELLVKIKLEEQNKWIRNVDESLKKFVELDSEYLKGLIDYSLNKIDEDEISKQIMELNKAQHSLVFYIHQLEYNKSSVEEVMDIIQNIVEKIDSQTTAAQEFRSVNYYQSEKAIKKISNITSENEKEIGDSNIELAMKIGELAKEEKKALANEVIESKFTKVLIGIFK
ncbi:hypothetical protein CD110_04725 [Staphylococcus casei]|uniref:hypothetical protein n=1 Tax=Staphylococcus TaxID=1279 RepID=UPI000CD2B59C|nr:hypothetical protein [Staphylococcus casei]PNZ60529.1 hypothetical protein CD110_04725 [Staphylococcus casei]WJE85737.1 hypothetical protein QMO72_09970 [Staphylococcus casei]